MTHRTSHHYFIFTNIAFFFNFREHNLVLTKLKIKNIDSAQLLEYITVHFDDYFLLFARTDFILSKVSSKIIFFTSSKFFFVLKPSGGCEEHTKIN